MKASEIFLDYVSPLYDEVPTEKSVTADVAAKELESVLRVPLLVWNAVVVDRNRKRKRGELPSAIKSRLPAVDRETRITLRNLLKMWVVRKDDLFSDCDWPLEIEVYANAKGTSSYEPKF